MYKMYTISISDKYLLKMNHTLFGCIKDILDELKFWKIYDIEWLYGNNILIVTGKYKVKWRTSNKDKTGYYIPFKLIVI